MTTPDQSVQPKDQMRSKILALEAEMRKLPQLYIQIDHFFQPGVYLRQMTMPKDSLVVGKIHKTEHHCILAKGAVTVASEEGKQTYSAPCVIHALPGAKRSLFAHEESVWINVHHNPTNEQDLEKIDDVFVTETYDQFLSFMEKKQIEGGK